MARSHFTLAIESAIRGGSIALARDGEIVDTWIGEGGISRAEDLLFNMDRILATNGIAKGSLSRIVVSVGPGSFTGIRIGLATAMGVAAALNIELCKYSVLLAMAAGQKDGRSVYTAVPVGRGVHCKQAFRTHIAELIATTDPIAISDVDFESEMLQIGMITPENFPLGLASSLIDATNDPRIAQSTEPLFIAKPSQI